MNEYCGHKTTFQILLIKESQCKGLQENVQYNTCQVTEKKLTETGNSYSFMILNSSKNIIIIRSLGCLQKKYPD